jgi:hypothetical protein
VGQPAQRPCNSLSYCRKKVEEIERHLDIYAPHQLSAQLLDDYTKVLSTAIENIRDQGIVGQGLSSRDGALSHMRDARNNLSLAFVERSKKGVTPRLTTYLKKSREHLEEALKIWYGNTGKGK